MTVASADWVDLIRRITLAGSRGGSLNAADTAHLARSIEIAIEGGRSLEAVLGLPAQWRSQWRQVNRAACVKALGLGRASDLSFATELHHRLSRYRSSPRFISDLEGRTYPTGDDWYLHALLRCNRNKVPKVAAIRAMLCQNSPSGI